MTLQNSFKNTAFPLVFITLIASFPFAVVSGQHTILDPFTVLKTQVEQTRGHPEKASLQALAQTFQASLGHDVFHADEHARRTIRAASDVAIALLASAHLTEEKLVTSKDDVLAAVEQCLAAIANHIDPHWSFEAGSANIAPPPGTPNAAAGMNPDAIKDPKLRKQYLDAVETQRAKGLKNDQQKQLRESRDELVRQIAALVSTTPGKGWSKNDILSRFGKISGCKELFEVRFDLK